MSDKFFIRVCPDGAMILYEKQNVSYKWKYCWGGQCTSTEWTYVLHAHDVSVLKILCAARGLDVDDSLIVPGYVGDVYALREM